MTRLALVTGSSRGIGSATVSAFVAAGWDVIGLDLAVPEGDEAPSTPGSVTRVVCDVSDPGQIEDAVAGHVGQRPLDALVNNAALQLNKPIAGTTVQEWDAVMNTNVRAAFVCIRECHAQLAAARGAVVNVASVHAVATSTNIGAYATSKGAMVALTRAAALELADAGVRCNAVLPGAVDTPMLNDGLARRPHPDGPEGNRRELVERTPLRAVGSPEAIAAAVLFLADRERSPFTTGQTLVIDGGATARLSTE